MKPSLSKMVDDDDDDSISIVGNQGTISHAPTTPPYYFTCPPATRMFSKVDKKTIAEKVIKWFKKLFQT